VWLGVSREVVRQHRPGSASNAPAAGVKRLRHPQRYHVSLGERLWRLKQALA